MIGERWYMRICGLPGLGNVGAVANGILRGAQPTREGYKTLYDYGVKSVLNLRMVFDEESDVLNAGLIPYWVPMRACDNDPEAEVAAALEVIASAAKPIYVHCLHGQDRTGVVCYGYRTRVLSWTHEQAWAEMQDYGFNDIWLGLGDWAKKGGTQT